MGRKICNTYSRGENYYMKFLETDLEDVYIIQLEKLEDERGFFTRVWDKKIFKDRGLNTDLVQMSYSYSKQKGTLRGMHFQETPFDEAKIVRCMKGKIFDVIIDLRKESQTYKKWISFELDDENRKMVYIPEGFAHGFQTLEDDTEVIYQMSQFYSPRHSVGFRWNDPLFEIKWPSEPKAISSKDLNFPDFKS